MKRRVRKQHSTILTATPLKEQMQQKEERRILKNIKIENKSNGKNVKGKNLAKGKSVKKKIFSDTENSEDETSTKNRKKKTSLRKTDDLEIDDLCAICGEFGRDREMWFRCCSCSNWIHKECSGKESAENFICDLCD